VVTSQRASSFSPFNSLRALVAPTGRKSIYGAYERPPFPIIVDTPTPRDIVGAWRLSDFIMAGTIYGSGIVWSYVISRPFPTLSQRLLVYHGISHLFFMLSLSLMITVPYRRLTGYWDNGLRWSRPEDKLKGGKYDNTSQFEANTIWGLLRPSKD
jgi:hypothetical protein